MAQTITVREYANNMNISLAGAYKQINEGRLPKGYNHIRVGKNTHLILVSEDAEAKQLKQTA